jgi:hypothetical protein
MDSKQIFMIVAIVAALNSVMIVTPVMAQNMTGANMSGKLSSFMPPNSPGCPVDAEGIERCPPQEQTESNGQSNGNENSEASGDGNEGDNSKESN